MPRPWPVVVALALAAAGCLEPPPAAQASAAPQDATAQPGEVLVPARKLAELYAVGEVRGFEFKQLGELIGRSYGRYDGPLERDGQTLHRFSTRVELLPPEGKPLRWASELLLDGAGNLVEGWERSTAAQLRFAVDGERELLAIEADAGLPDTETAELNYAEGTAFMAYMSTLHEELMLALRPLASGSNEWPLVSLSAGRLDLWTAEIKQQGKTVVVDTSLGEEIWLEQGRITRIEVPDDELVVTAVGDAVWPDWDIAGPQRLSYQPPAQASFTIRAVELPGQGDEPELRGDVLVPDPAVHGPGPHPAVVFLAGSVTADRYGFAGPPAVDLGYHEVTDALASAGFVVLRYDERGVGASEGRALSWIAQRSDARRAFRTLLVQPEVDPDRILAIGHAEGGWRALSLAAERPREVIGVALLATPGRSYTEKFADQPNILAALKSGEGLPAKLEPMAQWYGEIMVEDPEALVFRARVPLWIAQGGKDFEVDPIKDVAALQAAARKHKRRAELARFPELDHHFKAESGASSHASYLETRAVDPAFLAALVGWAERVTSAPTPAPKR